MITNFEITTGYSPKLQFDNDFSVIAVAEPNNERFLKFTFENGVVIHAYKRLGLPNIEFKDIIIPSNPLVDIPPIEELYNEIIKFLNEISKDSKENKNDL